MSHFDKTVSIQAPPDMVWQEAYRHARAGQIITDEPNRLLVAIHRKVGYVYWFEQEADGSTRLRHLIDSAPNVQESLRDVRDIPAALDALSARTDGSGQESLGLVVGLLATLGGDSWIRDELRP